MKRKDKWRIGMLLCTLLISVSSYAQITVKGIVKGEDGLEIPGANVVAKGAITIGAITDINGKFSISVPSEKTVLVFSFVGMTPLEKPVGKQRNMQIVLKDDSKVLDEVVVVGYGSMRKSDITGAVSSFRPDEKDAAKNVSIDNMLQGRIAGLTVGASVEAPGAASSVTIRGANSLRGDNQPLYVIDNIPQASSGEFISSGNDRTFSIATNALSSLNPADVESIEVLKDASATAIYGSRGANGVILITTKKGKSGKAKINVNANYTVATAANLLQMMDLKQFAQTSMIQGGGYVKDEKGEWNLWKKYKVTPGVFDPENAIYRNGDMEWNDYFQYHINGDDVYRKNGMDSKVKEKWSRLEPIDWQREIYTSALSQNYSVSVNGGSEKTTYFVSASYKDIQGLVRGTGLKQGDVRLNLNSDLSKTVKLTVSLSGSLKKNDMMAGGNETGGATGSISNVALYSAPYQRSQEELDNIPNLADRATIWTWVDDFDDQTIDKSFRGSVELTWKIFKFLSYNLRTGGNIAIQDRDRWFGITLYEGAMQNGYITQAKLNRNNYSFENVLQFNHSIGHIVDINATAAVTYDAYTSLNTLTVGNKFKIYDLRSQGLNLAGNVESKQPKQSDFQLLSYLGRLNLGFLDGRYLLTASIRADGSSKFRPGNRWASFPAATIAWRLEQENFIKKLDWIDQLKIRAGYGETGSQSIEPYSTFSNYASAVGDRYYGEQTVQSSDGNGTKLLGLLVDKMANDGLKWERTSSYNVGIDFSFFKNRIGGNVDVYLKTTKDLLIERDLPLSTGYSTITINQGSLRNRGIEVSLNGDIVRSKNFTWNLSGNISFNDPRIMDFGLPESKWGNETWKAYKGSTLGDHFGYANVFVVGKAPGLFYGFKTDGIIQNDDPYLKKVTKSIGALKPGEWKFVDESEDGTIDVNDKTIIGNPNPDFTYGIQTSFTWKDLSLSFAFNGVFGNDIMNANARYFRIPSNTASMLYAGSADKIWRNDNPWTGEYHGNELSSASSTTPLGMIFDQYVEDGSFLRCSDITLGYNLPAQLIKKIGFTNIGFYGSVKNAFVITKYSGYDPEVNTFAFDGTRPGIDISSFPHTRSFIIGLNLSF